MSYTVSYIANSYYGLAVWRAVAFNDHSTRVREMGKKRQLLARSRLEKDVFSSYVALQSARSLPPTPNSLSLRGWFFDDVDPPRRLKGDYYTCSVSEFRARWRLLSSASGCSPTGVSWLTARLRPLFRLSFFTLFIVSHLWHMHEILNIDKKNN